MSTGGASDVVPPLSPLVLSPGLEQRHRLVVNHTGASSPVFAIEATGGLHQVWMSELNHRFPGSVRRSPEGRESWRQREPSEHNGVARHL